MTISALHMYDTLGHRKGRVSAHLGPGVAPRAVRRPRPPQTPRPAPPPRRPAPPRRRPAVVGGVAVVRGEEGGGVAGDPLLPLPVPRRRRQPAGACGGDTSAVTRRRFLFKWIFLGTVGGSSPGPMPVEPTHRWLSSQRVFFLERAPSVEARRGPRGSHQRLLSTDLCTERKQALCRRRPARALSTGTP
jgi:hypothetical protein